MKKEVLILMLFATIGLSKSIAQTYFVNADFENSALPVGWTSTTATTGGQWVFGSGFTNAYLHLEPHTKYALINDAGCACVEDSARLTTPVCNMSTAATVFLTFDYLYGEYHLTGAPYAHEVFYVQYSINGGTTWSLLDSVTAANGWTTYGRDISSLVHNQAAVKIRFYYSDHNSAIVGAALDNIKMYAPLANDANLMSVAPLPGSPASYALVSTGITISGNLYNNGSAAITSCLIKYRNGMGPITSYTYSGNIASLATAPFTISTPFMLPATAGPNNVQVWVDLTNDTNHANDTLMTVLTGAAFIPVHKVTFEEETGCWCGWCVRGAVYMDSMAVAYPNTTELIAVHDADPMGNLNAQTIAYDAGATAMPGFSGFPSIEVERKVIDDPSAIFSEYTAHLGDFGVATMAVATTFNWGTRAAVVHATATFAIPVAAGDFNLAMVMVEDEVHSTSATYDQHDYYSYQSQNIALVGAGHNWQAETNPVPAAKMYYNHVARTIAGAYTGTAGSVPATAVNGVVNYTFNYTVPAGMAPEHMKSIVVLINNNNGQIVNANSSALSPTGINEVNASLNTVNIYPNPFSNQTTINFDLVKSSNVSVTITDIMGQVVDSFDNGMMSEGSHNIIFNAQDLTSGMYFVTLKTGANSFTQKISIQK